MKKLLNYFIVLVGLGVAATLSSTAPFVYHWLEKSPEHELLQVFFIIAVLFILSFTVFYISSGTHLPSFVVAIFFGIAAHNMLNPILEHKEVMAVLVGLGATLILFGGGLETKFSSFKKLFFKIASLTFPGLIFTAFVFSSLLLYMSPYFGATLSITTVVLLGAVLSSTDPAAIIPILKKLRFKNRATKDIIISESAVTDVTGTILTVVFLGLLAAGFVGGSISEWYTALATQKTALLLAEQLVFGIVFGVVGYLFLELLKHFKHSHHQEYEADSAFFLFIPIVIFTIALAFGGSGYLAAFIAGLLFHLSERLEGTERFFNHIIDGFFKPTIFILLGAIVDLQSLFSYAGLGIAAAVVFMFVIRPICVFLFLGPFSLFGSNRLGVRELLFISFVRETGAIPAVLMVTIAALQLPGIDGLVPIGMWVILLTLVLEPTLTNWVAKKLKVAEVIEDSKQPELSDSLNPVAVLATRGYSFLQRLPKVVEWASRHNVHHIEVLLCLEDKYSVDAVNEVKRAAEPVFERLNSELEAQGLQSIEFEFLSRTGFLQTNIEQLAKSNPNISVIFVGRKMLDYRPNEIKELSGPFYFME